MASSLAFACSLGSSPRGRGKQADLEASGNAGRLIPARAGKTIKVTLRANVAEAHPRAGGENQRGPV